MLAHRVPIILAVLAGFVAWVAYLRSPSLDEASTRQVETPVADAERPDEPFVFVDPAAASAFTVSPGVKKKELIGAGRVPYMMELVELELILGAEEASRSYREEAATYFGLQGDCELHVPGGDVYTLRRGAAVTVFPGVLHNAAHAGGPERCKVLRVVSNSGHFYSPTGEVAKASKMEDLKSVATAHETSLLSKKVYLSSSTVPGLFQVSLSYFAAGAECEGHLHRTASEVYVNFDGSGCHVEMEDWRRPGASSSYNISGGMVAVVNPTTKHRAWNAARSPCRNFNMIIGPPSR